jgi:type IV secretory pathway VirB9-like protein
MRVLAIILLINLSISAFEDLISNTIPKMSKENKVNNKLITPINLDQIQKAYFKNDSDAIIIYKYNPMKIMKVRTRILTKTTIILPKGEKPIFNSNGSDGAFKIDIVENKDPRYNLSNTFTITAKYIGTDTTLTIFGESGRIYNFYIYGIPLDSEEVANSTIFITSDGKLPKQVKLIDSDENDKLVISLKKEINRYKEKLYIKTQKVTKNLKNFNIASIQFDYNFKKDFKLDAIFNDDEFTYFKFSKDFNIPHFFYVNEKNDKIKLDFTVFENIIKVHKLSNNWSLELNGNYLQISKNGNFEIKYSNKKLYVDMTKTKFNIKSTSGDKKIEPQIIFYDNEFTYFKFDMNDNFQNFPTVYQVKDKKDNPAPFEIINDYIVVKNLNNKFTLRSGKNHNCIRLSK